MGMGWHTQKRVDRKKRRKDKIRGIKAKKKKK